MTHPSLFFSLALILISLVLTLKLTSIVKRILIARAILDIPNDRSSHSTPVPRGGGWAVIAILLPSLAAAAIFIDQDWRHVGLIIALLLLAGISWLDDRNHVSPAMRLSLHITAACLGSFSFPPENLLLNGLAPFWLDRTIMIIGWAWFINLYNFMDGIDGITGTETICIATGLCILLSATGLNDPFVEFTTLILTGTCLGFLAHNWHPARIFLGDIGSVPLGFLCGFCLLTLATQGHLIAALIIPLYYLADSGITITKRALRGEKIWQAHRQHFYQQAAKALGRHDKVVMLILITNLGLIASAIVSVSQPWAGLSLGVLSVAILLKKLHKAASKITV